MTVYVREYADIGVTYGKHIQSGAEPAIADQTVANAAGSVASNAFNAETRMVCVHTDAIISIAFGVTAPTAVTTNLRMAADTTMFFGVRPGTYLSVIDNT